MKKLIFILLLGLLYFKVDAQTPEKLLPDSTKITKDTIPGIVGYLDGRTIKVDSVHRVAKYAPLIMKVAGDPNPIRTDRVTVLGTDFYLIPSRRRLSEDDIIFFKPSKK